MEGVGRGQGNEGEKLNLKGNKEFTAQRCLLQVREVVKIRHSVFSNTRSEISDPRTLSSRGRSEQKALDLLIGKSTSVWGLPRLVDSASKLHA